MLSVKTKAILFAIISAMIICSLSVFFNVNLSNRSTNELFDSNVEALARGEVNVSTCLGLWGECTLPNGTKSKAPAIEISK